MVVISVQLSLVNSFLPSNYRRIQRIEVRIKESPPLLIKRIYSNTIGMDLLSILSIVHKSTSNNFIFGYFLRLMAYWIGVCKYFQNLSWSRFFLLSSRKYSGICLYLKQSLLNYFRELSLLLFLIYS